jgi:hypothetical protein
VCCTGGIIIVPLNFLCEKNNTLRKKFFKIYSAKRINIFEDNSFDDTSYTVCSILFELGESDEETYITSQPSGKVIRTRFGEYNNYTIGGEVDKNLPKQSVISRGTRDNTTGLSNIVIKCIDDGPHGKLGFFITDSPLDYVDNTQNLSARSYAVLCFQELPTLQEQRIIVERANNFLNTEREKYNSLFLTNFRDHNRKRITFNMAFRIINTS